MIHERSCARTLSHTSLNYLTSLLTIFFFSRYIPKTKAVTERNKNLSPEIMGIGYKPFERRKYASRKLQRNLIFHNFHFFGQCAAKSRTRTKAALTTLGRKPGFGKELEYEFLIPLLHIEAMFVGVTRRGVCSLVFQLAVRNNSVNTFGKDAGTEQN